MPRAAPYGFSCIDRLAELRGDLTAGGRPGQLGQVKSVAVKAMTSTTSCSLRWPEIAPPATVRPRSLAPGAGAKAAARWERPRPVASDA